MLRRALTACEGRGPRQAIFAAHASFRRIRGVHSQVGCAARPRKVLNASVSESLEEESVGDQMRLKSMMKNRDQLCLVQPERISAGTLL